MENIIKWCNILPFPSEWKEVIMSAGQAFDISKQPASPMENLLKALYDCAKLAEEYKAKCIDEKILLDTLEDIVVWTKNHYTVNGEIGLSETKWIKSHLNMELFCLGRLQFRYGKALVDSNRLKIKKGEPVMEVHIPQGKPLDNEECLRSLEKAVNFFEKYYPQCPYKYFTCESWLLDYNLKSFLREKSNIVRFQSLFDIVLYFESEQTVERLFTYNEEKSKESSLQKAVREHIKRGGKLFEGYGFLDKKFVLNL